MEKTYTALTIGPIYKTIQSARSTKAIWSASYMFSWIMKEIIKRAGLNPNEIIIPYFNQNDLNQFEKAGFYPDRIIYPGEITNLKQIISNVIKELSIIISNDINVPAKRIENFLEEYLRIIPIEVNIEKGNVIEQVSEYLNALELEEKIVSNECDDIRTTTDDEKHQWLIKFFEKYQDKDGNSEYNYFHRKAFTGKRFPSTAEIAAAEFEGEDFYKEASRLIKRDAEDDQEKFYEKIKEGAGDRFRNYQKYITVVQADGDNMGKLINEIYKSNPDLISIFSKKLLEFSKNAVELIDQYKGKTVYAGGDDLLFFAPVAHTGIIEEGNEENEITDGIRKTIFTLINQLDELFNQIFLIDKFNDHSEFANIINSLGDKKPSMSYGVSVSYYKFPLNEALEQAINRLFYTAKKTCKKNAVSYAVLKHSGQYFGTTFHKHHDSYKLYNELLQQKVKDSRFVHSVAHKLEPLNGVIKTIGEIQDTGERNNAFDNFFTNNFNESVHVRKGPDGTKRLIPFLEKVRDLFKAVYTENPVHSLPEAEKEKRHNDNLKKLYAALRFIEFINNKQEY